MSHSFIAILARGFVLFFALSVVGALVETNPVSNLPGWGSPPAAAAGVYCTSDVDANGVSAASPTGCSSSATSSASAAPPSPRAPLAPDATRTDPAAIAAHLETNRTDFDIDDNDSTDALTDGLLIIRRLFGFSGSTLTEGALAPDANRTDPAQIAASIGALGTCSAGTNQLPQVYAGAAQTITLPSSPVKVANFRPK
jgi:hypothetical protein